MTEWRPDQLVFVDESAANERTGDRKYGWAPVGAVAEVSELLKYTEKWSILPMFTVDGYEAWEVIHGSYNTELFNAFIENQVIPRMNPFPNIFLNEFHCFHFVYILNLLCHTLDTIFDNQVDANTFGK